MVFRTFFFVAIISLLFTGCQSDGENNPRLKIYTMDEELLPITVYVDGDSVGVLVKTAILTQIADGDTYPAFGSDGTFSMEVPEGSHVVEARSKPNIVADTADDFTDNLTDGFTLGGRWYMSLEVQKGWEYPLRIRKQTMVVNAETARPRTVRADF